MTEDPNVTLITVWNVWANSDLTEGRGHVVIIGTFDSEIAAKHFAKGKNVQGTDAEVRIGRAIYDRDTNQYFAADRPIKVLSEDPAETKKRILAKLTPEEQKFLGLSAK